MSQNFNFAIKKLMEDEGYYSNDLHDPGGETKYGISKKSYPEIDIKNLTIDEARAIYKKDYWDANRLNEIEDFNLSEKIFSFAVNCGNRQSIKILQYILNKYCNLEIKEDGILGKETLLAIKYSDIKVLLPNLILGYVRYYLKIKNNDRYIEGWVNRIVN